MAVLLETQLLVLTSYVDNEKAFTKKALTEQPTNECVWSLPNVIGIMTGTGCYSGFMPWKISWRLRFGKNSSSDFMPKKVGFKKKKKKKTFPCLHLSSNESLVWVNISEEDGGNTANNTVERIFTDVTQFYIGEHLNIFSKYFIIIQYAYK